MSTTVRCPSCERTLRVPPELLGQLVKCPSCQATFTAAEDGPAPGPGAAPAAPSFGDELEKRLQKGLPSRTEGPPSGPDDEDDDVPRRRPSPRRARDDVAAPATGLIVAGSLGLVASLLAFGVAVFSGLVATGAFGPGLKGMDRNDEAMMMVNVVYYSVIGALNLVLSVLILFGAIRMKNLQSYGWAMAACICGIIPCSGCCLLGMPFGIWGLVMLSRPEVKEAFRA